MPRRQAGSAAFAVVRRDVGNRGCGRCDRAGIHAAGAVANRSGRNTGLAMVGYAGQGDRPEYAAVGDTVNAAFRLESATKQTGAEMMIGEQAYARLFRHSVDAPCDHTSSAVIAPFTRHVVQLKGYDGSLNAYGCSFPALRGFLEASRR